MSKPDTILVVTEFPSNLADWVSKFQANKRITVHHKTLSERDRIDRQLLESVTVLVEWLPVNKGQKLAFYKNTAAWFPPDMVVMTSAHDRMATQTALAVANPERVVGFSPFSSLTQGDLLTLAYTLQSSEKAKETAQRLAKWLEMDFSWIQDTPGMVLPRIYAMLANEAAFALQERVATATDIDTAMCLGTNYPMGPLSWADQVGVDVVLAILEHLHGHYREERYRPCPLIGKMVMTNQLGRKSGRGFYLYQAAEKPQGKEMAKSR